MKFLFDLGGVFFDWDPHYFYKDVIKDKEEREIKYISGQETWTC